LQEMNRRRELPYDLERLRREIEDLPSNPRAASAQALRLAGTIRRWRKDITHGA
jgi:hypothetical protein